MKPTTDIDLSRNVLVTSNSRDIYSFCAVFSDFNGLVIAISMDRVIYEPLGDSQLRDSNFHNLPFIFFPVAQICPISHKIVSSSPRAFPVAEIRLNLHKIVSSHIRAFPVTQICPNMHKIVSSSNCCWERFYASLDKSVLQGMLL